jgi:hypothetical protein
MPFERNGIAYIHIDPIPTNIVFKFLALSALEFMELFKVSEPLSRRLKARFLSVDGLSKKLFSGDLLRRRSLILDPRRAS